MAKETRRSFVKKTGASLLASGAWLGSGARVLGANDRPVLALIGGRNRGRQVALGLLRAGAEFKTICDIDDDINAKVGAEIEGVQKKRPGLVREFQRVIDDKDIDGLVIATPDHWHAIQTLQACGAGKDVLVEKPLSQTIEEGHLMREAARKHRRVVQVGTQRRSGEHYRNAIDYLSSGKLGKLCLIKAWMYQVRNTIGNPPDGPVPGGVDYDLWLGPAPQRPFNPNRFHYNWRFFWDYGNSELGNQGVHMLDIAVWGIQKLRGNSGALPTHISGQGGIYWLDDAKEVPDTQVVTYDYGDFMLVWELHSFQNHGLLHGLRAGTAFYGTDASLVVHGDGWEVTGKDGAILESAKSSGGSHEQNFIDCMKSRKEPNADIETGRLSTTLCHLGNISYHLKRDVSFDPKTETFGTDRAANALLKKEYRKPYVLPKV
jgi:predicted dehydrogenase